MPATLLRLPPDLDRLARAHRRRQQSIAAQLLAAVRRLWRFVATSGWLRVAARVLGLVQAAMLEAASGAQAYVAAAAGLWGREPDPAGTVAERTFAATASDGRPLDSLLGYPAFEAEAFTAGGMDRAQAYDIAGRHLERIAATQVADAARVATGVAQVNDRAIGGYIRLLTPPSCNRCIILAGSFYRTLDGFQRHPQCDCVHVPAAEVVEPISPLAIFKSMSDEERRRAGWNGHDVRAIEDGADIYQTTNYKRALRTVHVAGRPVKTTLVGTTTRGFAGGRLGARQTGVKGKTDRYRRARPLRLTPEQIYVEAGDDRGEALRLLRLHGYLVR